LFEETKQVLKSDSDVAEKFKLSDWEFKPTMIDMQRVLIGKVDRRIGI
jgi:hypothetical protein